MSWEFLMWLFAFVLQAGMLGRTMYTLICLSDLENDFINPYDLTTRLNRFVMLEYAAQAVLTTVLLASGKWFVGLLHLGVLCFFIKMYMMRQHTVDTTDVFKQLPQHKQRRMALFVFFIVTFVLVTYRLLECCIHSLLTEEGRETAKRLFKEAASSLHGY